MGDGDRAWRRAVSVSGWRSPYGLEAVGWAIAGRNLLTSLAISTAGGAALFSKLPPVLLAGAVLRPALAAVAMVAAILALEHTELTDGDSLRGLAILVAGGARCLRYWRWLAA